MRVYGAVVKSIQNMEMTAFQGVCYYHAVELSTDDAGMENVRMSRCWKHRRLKTRNGMTCLYRELSTVFLIVFKLNNILCC